LYIDAVDSRMPHPVLAGGETIVEAGDPILMSKPNRSTPEETPEKGRTPDSTQPEEKPDDEVDEAGEESFPASDAPPWTGAAAQ
jgi:hypothetical protein